MASTNNYEDISGIVRSSILQIFLQIIVTTPPNVENLIAFDIKFNTTYYNLLESRQTV